MDVATDEIVVMKKFNNMKKFLIDNCKEDWYYKYLPIKFFNVSSTITFPVFRDALGQMFFNYPLECQSFMDLMDEFYKKWEVPSQTVHEAMFPNIWPRLVDCCVWAAESALKDLEDDSFMFTDSDSSEEYELGKEKPSLKKAFLVAMMNEIPRFRQSRDRDIAIDRQITLLRYMHFFLQPIIN